jgi:hypothetical protein
MASSAQRAAGIVCVTKPNLLSKCNSWFDLPPARHDPARREFCCRWNGLDYFCTVNGVENAVLSHIIFNSPPPEGFFEIAIVN